MQLFDPQFPIGQFVILVAIATISILPQSRFKQFLVSVLEMAGLATLFALALAGIGFLIDALSLFRGFGAENPPSFGKWGLTIGTIVGVCLWILRRLNAYEKSNDRG